MTTAANQEIPENYEILRRSQTWIISAAGMRTVPSCRLRGFSVSMRMDCEKIEPFLISEDHWAQTALNAIEEKICVRSPLHLDNGINSDIV